MKYIAILALLLAACSPIADMRAPAVAAATQTARASQPLPSLPRTLKIWILPQVTPAPEGK